MQDLLPVLAAENINVLSKCFKLTTALNIFQRKKLRILFIEMIKRINVKARHGIKQRHLIVDYIPPVMIVRYSQFSK